MIYCIFPRGFVKSVKIFFSIISSGIENAETNIAIRIEKKDRVFILHAFAIFNLPAASIVGKKKDAKIINIPNKNNIKKILEKIFDQCFIMDKLGINKFEMHHPYKHILINKDKVTFLDFERCRFTEDPKNVSQLCDFIISKEIIDILAKKGFNYKNKDIK